MRRLVLVGGGHAHVEIVRRWGAKKIPGVELTVVDPNPRPIYSGMVPGFVAGEYTRDELEFDLPDLCRRSGAVFVEDRAKTIDAEGRGLRCEGKDLEWDVASLDIGSTVAGTHLPGVCAHAIASRPIPGLVGTVGQLVAKAKQKAPEPFVVHVVGGGAGGVELAFCLDARLRREGATPEVVLATAEGALLSGGSAALRRAVVRSARRRGIRIVTHAQVCGVEAGAIYLEEGRALVTDATLWVTGPAARPFGAESGLPVDDQGFVRIDDTLRVVGHDDLFAVGDCASLSGMKRAGVYAVRSAPLLDHNLRARFDAGPDAELRRYRPQSDFLSLLNLGDGTAIGTKWAIAVTGRTVLRIKDRIDRSFMEKYR